jgi:hypothetical protein
MSNNNDDNTNTFEFSYDLDFNTDDQSDNEVEIEQLIIEDNFETTDINDMIIHTEDEQIQNVDSQVFSIIEEDKIHNS